MNEPSNEQLSGKAQEQANDQSSLPSNKPVKKSPAIIIAIVIAVVFIFAAVITYFTVWYVPDNSTDVEVIRNRTIKKFEKDATFSKDKKGWFMYKEAAEKFKDYHSKNPGKSPSNIDSEGWSNENTGTIVKYFNDNQEVLKFTEKIYLTGFSIVPRDYKQGLAGEVPDFLALREFAYLLALGGDVLASEGRYYAAANLYQGTLWLAVDVGHNGTLIMGMINIALEGIAFRHLISFINDNDLDAETCRKIIELLNITKLWRSSFLDFMDNEAVCTHYTFELLRSGKVQGQGQVKPRQRAKWLMDREERMYENQYLKDRQNVLLKYRQACEALPDDPEKVFPKTSILAKIGYPNYKRAYKQDTYSRMQYRGVAVAAALKLYKIEKGKFPDSLSQLDQSLLESFEKDPYATDGKLIYKKDGENVILYSIGPDLKDDNGTPRVQVKEVDAPGDVIFFKSSKK